MDAPPAAVPKQCCVCEQQGGKQCTKCKSRHYCSKECQLVDWNERGHREACKQLTAELQGRLDSRVPEKLKLKKAEEEAPGSSGAVEDAPADGCWYEQRPAFRAAVADEATAAKDDAPDWRGNCAICTELLPAEAARQTFYDCCCKKICAACAGKCVRQDQRCPLCLTPRIHSATEWVRRVQKHVDEGRAEAQVILGNAYHDGDMGLKKSPKRAFQLHERAAAQGHARAQNTLGSYYEQGEGVKINNKAAAQWYRRAADQGHPGAQCNLGAMVYEGLGVAQSHEEAVRWWRLSAAQGQPAAFYFLGASYTRGHGVPRDDGEALRFFKHAAAKGHADAAAAVGKLEAWLAADSGRPT